MSKGCLILKTMKKKTFIIDDENILLSLSEGAFINAEELLSDSRLLYKNGRYARSVFLSQIAAEEMGKAFYCFSAYIDYRLKELDIKSFTKLFYSHHDKAMMIDYGEDFFLGLEYKEYKERKREIGLLQTGKMWALYVDYYDNKYISFPSLTITEEAARLSLSWNEKRIKTFKKIGFPQSLSIKTLSDEELKIYSEKFYKRLINGELSDLFEKIYETIYGNIKKPPGEEPRG
jgi:AbiV family abortive infection protein